MKLLISLVFGFLPSFWPGVQAGEWDRIPGDDDGAREWRLEVEYAYWDPSGEADHPVYGYNMLELRHWRTIEGGTPHSILNGNYVLVFDDNSNWAYLNEPGIFSTYGIITTRKYDGIVRILNPGLSLPPMFTPTPGTEEEVISFYSYLPYLSIVGDKSILGGGTIFANRNTWFHFGDDHTLLVSGGELQSIDHSQPLITFGNSPYVKFFPDKTKTRDLANKKYIYFQADMVFEEDDYTVYLWRHSRPFVVGTIDLNGRGEFFIRAEQNKKEKSSLPILIGNFRIQGQGTLTLEEDFLFDPNPAGATNKILGSIACESSSINFGLKQHGGRWEVGSLYLNGCNYFTLINGWNSMNALDAMEIRNGSKVQFDNWFPWKNNQLYVLGNKGGNVILGDKEKKEKPVEFVTRGGGQAHIVIPAAKRYNVKLGKIQPLHTITFMKGR